jgi:cytochrome c-type biogenesis protein
MDIVRVAISQAAFHSAWSIPAAMLAGVATSFGPCVAPRFVAIMGFADGSSAAQRWKRLIAFTFGLCACYVAIGCIASLLGRMTAWSGFIYWGIAGALAVVGLRTIFSDERPACTHEQSKRRVSVGAAFLIGCSLGLVVSPCCTPVIAALAGLSAAAGDPLFGAAVLGSFAFGHALPILIVGAGFERCRQAISRFTMPSAVTTVSGALMLALSGYYALLA